MTRAAPLWLRVPSRFAGVARARARLLIAALAVLLVVAAVLAGGGAAPLDDAHDATVAAMRHGAGFYEAIFFTRATAPLPTLALVEAALPDWGVVLLLCAVLAALLLAGWEQVLRCLNSAGGRLAGAGLLLLGAAAGAVLALAAPHRGWAALLAGWALLARRPGRWIEAAAIGCIAALVDPAATVALVVMAAVALSEGARREAISWAIAAIVALAELTAHAVALGGWMPERGVTGSLAALVPATTFPALPAALAGIGVALAATGWAGTREPLATRLLALAAAGLAAEALTPLPAATLAIVVLPLGLAFVPDGARDLARAALDRRRITVTRIAR